MQHKFNIQQRLLDFSADQETPYVPIILQGRFFKRISKEEIRGWSSAQAPPPFQKQNSPQLHHRHSKLQTITPRAAKTPTAQPKLKRKDSLLRQFNSARELDGDQPTSFNSLFKTFQHLPELAPVGLPLADQPPQETKIDFIQGKKLSYPKARSTLIVKPFFTSLSLRNNSSKPHKSSLAPSKLLQHQRTSVKSAPKEKPSGLFLISYPIESSPPVERSFAEEHGRFSHFIRRLKR